MLGIARVLPIFVTLACCAPAADLAPVRTASPPVRIEPVAAPAVAPREDRSERDPPPPGDDAPAIVGQPAPPIRSNTLNGRGTFDLAAQRGRVVVVAFCASWCEPCKKQLPALEAIDAGHPGIEIVAVFVDDDATDASAFVNAHRTTFPAVWDAAAAIAQRYEPRTMPTTYVIGKDGVVRFVHFGWQDDVARAIDAEVTSLR